jgi:hypothetical protein
MTLSSLSKTTSMTIAEEAHMKTMNQKIQAWCGREVL